MSVRLEHANLSVANLDGIVTFLRTAFPEFRVRHDQTLSDGARWVHVGTDDTYVALNQRTAMPDDAAGLAGAPTRQARFHHLAYVVDDVEALRLRLRTAGFHESGRADAHPARRRAYFLDPDGNEWEFVEYLVEDAARRHDYALPDRYEALG